MKQRDMYNRIMEAVSVNLKKALNETSTGEFTGNKRGKLGIGKSAEYKKYISDHEIIAKWRKIAQKLFSDIDRFRPGQTAKMWDYVHQNIGQYVRLGNIFGTTGRGSDAMTCLDKNSAEAGWSYAPGWDSWTKIKDLDSIHTYTTGYGVTAKSGKDEDLLEWGFDQVYSWLKTILFAIGDAQNGYQDFEDNTFFNCKNGSAIRKKFGYKV